MRRILFVILIIVFPSLHRFWQRLRPPRPKLDVLMPLAQQTIVGTELDVCVRTAHVKLTSPPFEVLKSGLHGADVNRGRWAHLMLTLDDEKPVAWGEAQPYRYVDLRPGNHTLHVELVKHDFSSYNPPMVRNIQFRAEIRSSDQTVKRLASS